MSFVARYMKRPHLLLSIVLLLSVVGVVGYFRMPVNLFPDSERPQIAIVTVWRGASADDLSSQVSRVVEKKLKTIDLVRRVTSTSNDEVSVVNAEFQYEKGLDSAATDVRSALDEIRPLLPADIRPPQLFKISSATPAVLTLSVGPRDGSHLDLAMVRRLAENPIKERLLALPEIGNVEVFGGYQQVMRVTLDADRLQAFRISPAQVASALAGLNKNAPEGLVVTDATHLLLETAGELRTPGDVAAAVVSGGPGPPVYLRDVATVAPGIQERLSAFHGNGKPAIGIAVQRPLSGHTLPTIRSVTKALPALERDFPGLSFEVADTQGDLVQKSVSNMADALRDAILMTALVIFLFLADVRGMLLAAVSIPFTYLVTFAFMWLFGFELNMVTLTGVILGVGMLLDDAIVVLENIERHHRELGKDLRDAVVGGTEEVMLAILSGTYATVVVLVPIVFIGGFVQTVLRPLSLTLSIALLASYVVSVTVIPILAPVLLRLGGRIERSRLEKALGGFVSRRVLGPVQELFARGVRLALRRPLPFLLPALAMLVVAGRVVLPLVGRDLMPPMDTGIFRVTFEAYPNASLASAESLLGRVEKIVRAQEGVVRTSATLGSEPGVLSFGSGRNPQQAFLTAHLVDRFHRKRTVWQVEDEILRRLRDVPGIRYPAVFDYGATPLSTIRSTVDVVVSGPDPRVLDRIARDVEGRLRNAGGVRSLTRTWTLDRAQLRFTPAPESLSLAGVDASSVAAQLGAQVQGGPATLLRVPQQDSYPLWVQASPSRRAAAQDLATLPIFTATGPVPLSSLGTVSRSVVPTLHTRQNLLESVDVLGYRGTDAVTHVGANVDAALAGIDLPPGYTLADEGERKAMGESFSALTGALLLGLVLLYFSLVPAFRSFLHPLTIMAAIPLGLVGAGWAMLATGKHQSMPSFMGMILLAGIVVKNSILLVDFVQEARARGASIEDALVGAVRVRTRPILMTAAGTAVGMLPIALEWAIGLERLSPLAVVAIGGLVVSTLLTLLYVPLLYDLLERARSRLGRALEAVRARAPEAAARRP